jgi:hypothetical protein
VLNPRWTSDIEDIVSGDETFSDGCGLISRGLAVQISRSKKIIFRGNRYTPCVFQIRCVYQSFSEEAFLMGFHVDISVIKVS